ncbi:hypothetical protein [Desertibacillus haloalkaliphilus]|uniref:hypothetical protein n=1 Tax=Desertibacillus haloalkaliphilus TaxID=1328930 RepID=UPI001C279D54|nr:hypothetical protein [Desertibacillus haloalkaliphilus]MBU8907758.1 hypothetical protein [Desertibacillus haloalkaliphilus]
MRNNNMSQALLLFMACTLLVALFTNQPLIYAEEGEGSQEAECQYEDKIMHTHENFSIHLNLYYQLLAEKFAPEYVDVWQEINKERELIRKKLQEAKKKGELLHGDVVGEEWLKKHESLQTEFTNAVQKQDDQELKELIPKLFTNYKELNELFKKRLELSQS